MVRRRPHARPDVGDHRAGDHPPTRRFECHHPPPRSRSAFHHSTQFRPCRMTAAPSPRKKTVVLNGDERRARFWHYTSPSPSLEPPPLRRDYRPPESRLRFAKRSKCGMSLAAVVVLTLVPFTYPSVFDVNLSLPRLTRAPPPPRLPIPRRRRRCTPRSARCMGSTGRSRRRRTTSW